MRMKAISFAFFSVFQRLENRWLRDTAMQGILPSLGMGRLLKWSRDAEFSADRAGLLCCQSDRVAYDALMNLSLGLRPDSPWRDQQYESLDEDVVIQNFDDWGNRPLVEFFIEVKKWSATHPFIPDRLAAIKAWWKTGGAESVLARTADTTCTLDLNFTSIGVEGLEEGSDPYLIALDHNGLELGRTPTQSDKQNAFWRDLSWLDVPNDVGNPVFVQVWEENYSLLPDSLLGVFVVYPNREDLVYRSTILWDVDDRTGVSRNGVGSIKFKRK